MVSDRKPQNEAERFIWYDYYNGAWRIKPRNLFRFLGCFCFYKQRGEEVDERRPTYVNIDDEKQCMWYRDGTWWLGTKNYLNRATGDLYCAHEAAMTPDMGASKTGVSFNKEA